MQRAKAQINNAVKDMMEVSNFSEEDAVAMTKEAWKKITK
jgi:hypothetical protein